MYNTQGIPLTDINLFDIIYNIKKKFVGTYSHQRDKSLISATPKNVFRYFCIYYKILSYTGCSFYSFY